MKKLGYIGLGKMGINMVERLIEKGYQVVVTDQSKEARERASERGAETAGDVEELMGKLNSPRLIWIMVPYTAVNVVVQEIESHLVKGDTVIDGGNSPYEESMKRAKRLGAKSVYFLDVGVSGGPEGARNGACMMVGGARSLYEKYEGLFKDLCVPKGYGYMGNSGAGHFVKMIHNGIEYGMMQALAEGFNIMKCSPFELDLKDIARVYNHGSVIESRLIGWLGGAYKKFGSELKGITGSAAASGEGEWTVRAAHELGISDEVIHESLRARHASQENPNYQGQIISALRNQFGGHSVRKKD